MTSVSMASGVQMRADGSNIRFLGPDESHIVTDAICAAYGDSYDDQWVYDPVEIRARMLTGRLICAVAEASDGALLCHCALGLGGPLARTAHAGQAVTMPAARGHHLFTAVKAALAAEATRRGLAGIYSEATAAHPYSQRANIDLGAHETGFLLGWIPASVSNDAAVAASGHRQSAALFYLRTNSGEPRPAFVPERHRDVVHETITLCGLHARLAQPPRRHRRVGRSVVHTAVVTSHNLAVVNVAEPGADLVQLVATTRSRLFGHGIDALYVDLPLDLPGTAHLGAQLEELGVSYSGVFPNSRSHGDVLRLQSLNGVSVHAGDVAVASEHGRALLDYVLAELAATGHHIARGPLGI
jgi:hypothetical protein